jgi:hypothetical protein
MMVNYAYDLDSIERNHERLIDQGEIAAARAGARARRPEALTR